MEFHGPLHSLPETIVRNKAAIIGSYYPNSQKGMPKGMVNNIPASFTICIIHKKFIKRRITTVCVLYGILRRAYNSKSISVSIAAREGVHNRLSPMCSYSNQTMGSRGANVSSHQDFNQLSRLSDLSVSSFTNKTNCKGSRPLITPPRLLPLERPYIPTYTILVPVMCTECTISPPLICT